jgi:hypothetical protein
MVPNSNLKFGTTDSATSLEIRRLAVPTSPYDAVAATTGTSPTPASAAVLLDAECESAFQPAGPRRHRRGETRGPALFATALPAISGSSKNTANPSRN